MFKKNCSNVFFKNQKMKIQNSNNKKPLLMNLLKNLHSGNDEPLASLPQHISSCNFEENLRVLDHREKSLDFGSMFDSRDRKSCRMNNSVVE